MLLKRKSKNRRLERSSVLEVKLRSRQVRARRVRLAGAILAFVLGLPLAGLVVWRGSQWALTELVFKNPSFSIRQIDIRTDGVIPAQQLRHWAGVKEGDNLFALDLLRIERDLELVPWIRRAVVERVLPHTLKIRIAEREPVAQISRFQGVAANEIIRTVTFIDQAGYVMPALQSPRLSVGWMPAVESLPVLAGVTAADLRPGRRVELPEVHAALQLITAFDRSPMAGLTELDRIDLSTSQLLQISTRQGNEITFAPQDLETQLRRWRIVQDYAQSVGRSIATLDLSVSNNVPARWRDSSIDFPMLQHRLKPPLLRKKHV